MTPVAVALQDRMYVCVHVCVCVFVCVFVCVCTSWYKEKICGCTSCAFADERVSLATGIYMVHDVVCVRASVWVCVCVCVCVCRGVTHGTTTTTMVVPLFVQDGPPNSSEKAIKKFKDLRTCTKHRNCYFHCKEHTDLMPSTSSYQGYAQDSRRLSITIGGWSHG